MQPLHGSLEKVLVINWCKTGMIGNNVFFPLFDERQRGRFLYFLQQAIYESRQLSKSVVTLICCSGRVNEFIGKWNRNMCYRQGDIDCAHQSLTTMYLSTRKQNMESPWSNTWVFPEVGTSTLSRSHDAPWKRNQMHGTTHRFQEGDAADGTSFVPFVPCRSTLQFPSSKTKHSTMNAGTENCTNMTKQEEDLTTRLFPSSLRPVSFKKETIRGQTPMMVATTSTKFGILKSLVRMAFFKAGRKDIQSRVSAPFSRLTMYSVIGSPSKLPNTMEDVRCRHRLKSRRSKTG